MDARFLRHYNRELQHLREVGPRSAIPARQISGMGATPSTFAVAVMGQDCYSITMACQIYIVF